jgi:1-acyl-sn-glycerol-3-phosphate acyltransferase
MQRIVFEEPYQFIPPITAKYWPAIIKQIVRGVLRRSYGVHSFEYRGLELYHASLAAGHGILLACNHCRPADPLVAGSLVKATGQPLYAMASWHLFKQSRLQTFLIRRCGAFSIYREGVDRAALNMAIDILVAGQRPLLIFPEGAVSRTNDHLNALLDGTAFIARTAAKRRTKAARGRVVVHPLLLKYIFQGDLEASLTPVLADIEQRLTWQPQEDLSLIERIFKIGDAVLTLKELEYLGEAHRGSLHERIEHLREAVLTPIEMEWGACDDSEGVIGRVKRLRSAILPDMVAGKVTADERRRRWRQLGDLYFAQQLSFYPPEYVRSNPTPERILETVERFDEDLHDEARIHRPLHAIVQIGEAIEVSPERERTRGESDPLITELTERMRSILAQLQEESGPPLPLPETLAAGGW